jgi:hypothetical protein
LLLYSSSQTTLTPVSLQPAGSAEDEKLIQTEQRDAQGLRRVSWRCETTDPDRSKASVDDHGDEVDGEEP